MKTLFSAQAIEQIAPGRLKPWARNARTHARKQIRQVADSIRTFGFTNPVLIDAQYRAARESSEVRTSLPWPRKQPRRRRRGR